MNIIDPTLKEIQDRVEGMAIENDYARTRLELQLVCAEYIQLKQQLEIEKEHTKEWKRIAQKIIKGG